jgi:hypothetical protein
MINAKYEKRSISYSIPLKLDASSFSEKNKKPSAHGTWDRLTRLRAVVNYCDKQHTRVKHIVIADFPIMAEEI